MKSQEVQNQLIDPKNKSTEIYNGILFHFGMQMFQPFCLGSVIKNMQSDGFTVESVLGVKMPDVDIEAVKDVYDGKFKERFFSNLLFKDENEKSNFEFIVSHIGRTYVPTSVELKRVGFNAKLEDVVLLYVHGYMKSDTEMEMTIDSSGSKLDVPIMVINLTF